MYKSVPSPAKLIASFPYLTLQKVSEGDYNSYIQAWKEFKENLASVFMQRGGGQYGHTGNILLKAQYALIRINTPYVITPNTGPLPVIMTRLTSAQSGNLVRAHIEALC